MRDFNIFRKDNTEGYDERSLRAMNEYYRASVVELDSTSDNYDNEIKNLQESILRHF